MNVLDKLSKFGAFLALSTCALAFPAIAQDNGGQDTRTRTAVSGGLELRGAPSQSSGSAQSSDLIHKVSAEQDRGQRGNRGQRGQRGNRGNRARGNRGGNQARGNRGRNFNGNRGRNFRGNGVRQQRRAYRQGFRQGQRRNYRRNVRRNNFGFYGHGYRAPVYRAPVYRAPVYHSAPVYHGPAYSIGGFYGRHQSTIIINDYGSYGLYAPPRGYHWVCDKGSSDAILAAVATGAIIAIAADVLSTPY